MHPKNVVLSLPVNDLSKSLTFYRDGLKVKTSDIEEDMITVTMGPFEFFLIGKSMFESYTSAMNVNAHIDSKAVGSILSCAMGSREEIDRILKDVVKHGGVVEAPAREQDKSYMGYFQDPDGHMWELVCNETTENA